MRRRIIPARAGFTYFPYRAGFREAGSSPLARGLRHETVGPAVTVGIIPARAGFTSGTISITASPSGSSPLARGLQSVVVRGDVRPGIIPARAGFTPLSPQRSSSGWDHPRSRGVYSAQREARTAITGSSPLARGLLQHAELGNGLLRIIPARAGFTSRPTSIRRTGSDHPRSRGVYVRRLEVLAGAVGIIPARAGFTPRLGRRSGRRWDHPRSRGVYSSCRACRAPSSGSSPLARGLPHRLGVEFIERGIIPARAGFTKRRRTQQ